MKYAFNENIITQTGTPGSIVSITIEGVTVKAAVDKGGRASVNASPFYQALFASEEKNGANTFQTVKGDVKYGYLDFGETSERYGTQRSKYSESSSVGKCQTMVRFLDHYGNWCYWVMETGTKTTTDAQKGEMLTSVSGTHAVRRPQVKTSADSLVLCAPKVDEETFMFLCDIKRSVHVCIKGASGWVPVVVSSGSSAWVRDQKRMERQDFEITVVMNENEVGL